MSKHTSDNGRNNCSVNNLSLSQTFQELKLPTGMSCRYITHAVESMNEYRTTRLWLILLVPRILTVY